MHMHMHCTCSHGIPHLIAINKNHMSNGSKWVEMGRNGSKWRWPRRWKMAADFKSTKYGCTMTNGRGIARHVRDVVFVSYSPTPQYASQRLCTNLVSPRPVSCNRHRMRHSCATDVTVSHLESAHWPESTDTAIVAAAPALLALLALSCNKQR
ncbi:hypothetical protein BD777DRAFT_7556 [Yarrowia lipolytica]|uniref:Uncharacterized protein n=1 Tax=Yarrowia lipolytica TaxID=4952 RepID=A0A1D8NJ56_YARLL|nr:hypothetical protein YALI1_E23452g [Yarrowia lipolytica]RMI96527.1 hypothetical protein BD777DRAFT_7556 [Yarrowia lipolytica]